MHQYLKNQGAQQSNGRRPDDQTPYGMEVPPGLHLGQEADDNILQWTVNEQLKECIQSKSKGKGAIGVDWQLADDQYGGDQAENLGDDFSHINPSGIGNQCFCR